MPHNGTNWIQMVPVFLLPDLVTNVPRKRGLICKRRTSWTIWMKLLSILVQALFLWLSCFRLTSCMSKSRFRPTRLSQQMCKGKILRSSPPRATYQRHLPARLIILLKAREPLKSFNSIRLVIKAAKLIVLSAIPLLGRSALTSTPLGHFGSGDCVSSIVYIGNSTLK
jgi:hypothetical protein